MSAGKVDRAAEHHRRVATTWAAGTLAKLGATLHAVPGGGWDVELPDGSWRPVEDWRELCALARIGGGK